MSVQLFRAFHVPHLAIVLVAVMCGWCPPRIAEAQEERVATALLRVSRPAPLLVEEDYRPPSESELATFRNTQAELVKSRFVLEAALRRKGVAEIEAIQGADNAVRWLKERLEVDFPGDGEIMRVRFADGVLDDAELEAILNSVVESYVRDVVEAERTELLLVKDMLAQQLERMSNDLNRQRIEYFDLVEHLGGGDSPFGNIHAEMLQYKWRTNRDERRELQQQLADAYMAYQLELVDLGAVALPDSALDHDASHSSEGEEGQEAKPRQDESSTNLPAREDGLIEREPEGEAGEQARRARARYEVISQIQRARITQLDMQAEELAEELRRLSRQSAELQARQEALKRQAELVEQMSQKLMTWDLQQTRGIRVKKIQNAVVEPADR